MTLINYTNPRLLIADEGKMIRDRNDVYIPEHIDEETGKVMPEHKPYYSSVLFPAISIDTLEKAMELYVEEEIEKE